mmetsp:Transcript_36619/g.80040  ORF Transcript_36619/g.80040 Transcript_36619/m.80040 type:complete len:320 (+) Transcript_36619:201-1160(+)
MAIDHVSGLASKQRSMGNPKLPLEDLLVAPAARGPSTYGVLCSEGNRIAETAVPIWLSCARTGCGIGSGSGSDRCDLRLRVPVCYAVGTICRTARRYSALHVHVAISAEGKGKGSCIGVVGAAYEYFVFILFCKYANTSISLHYLFLSSLKHFLFSVTNNKHNNQTGDQTAVSVVEAAAALLLVALASSSAPSRRGGMGASPIPVAAPAAAAAPVPPTSPAVPATVSSSSSRGESRGVPGGNGSTEIAGLARRFLAVLRVTLTPLYVMPLSRAAAATFSSNASAWALRDWLQLVRAADSVGLGCGWPSASFNMRRTTFL